MTLNGVSLFDWCGCTLAEKTEGYVLRLMPACSVRCWVLSASAARCMLAPGMLLHTMTDKVGNEYFKSKWLVNS